MENWSWDSHKVGRAVSQGLDLESRDRDGNTALLSVLSAYERGSMWGTYDLALQLLAHGADAGALKKEQTPEDGISLFPAQKESESSFRSTLMFNIPARLVSLLVDRGAPLSFLGANRMNALMFSASQGQMESTQRCRILLSHGAMVDEADGEGNTALFYAKQREVVLLLASFGADINHQNHKGETALMYHLRGMSADKELVRTLLGLGTDTSIQDNEGNSAYDIARKHHWTRKVVQSFTNSSNV